MKYIPLSPNDPKSYVSFGLDLRERFESLKAATFGVGGIPAQNYVLDREYIHADIRPNQNWQIFVQLQKRFSELSKGALRVLEWPLSILRAAR